MPPLGKRFDMDDKDALTKALGQSEIEIHKYRKYDGWMIEIHGKNNFGHPDKFYRAWGETEDEAMKNLKISIENNDSLL